MQRGYQIQEWNGLTSIKYYDSRSDLVWQFMQIIRVKVGVRPHDKWVGQVSLSLIGLKRSATKPSVPASFLAAELAMVHTTNCITIENNPAPSTFKLNNLMSFNHGIEQRRRDLVNLAIRVSNWYQPPESESPHNYPPFYLNLTDLHLNTCDGFYNH